MDLVNLVIFVGLIIGTAFFVAAEFALVKVRESKIEQLIQEGNKKAHHVKEVITNLDEYLSACQLGITITALGIGMVGEKTFEHMIHSVLSFIKLPESFAMVVSFIIAYILVTFIHVVIGELVPKTFAIAAADKISLLTSGPLIMFTKVLKPFISLMNGSARLICAIFGLKPAGHGEHYSEEELIYILNASKEHGEITESEADLVNNVFQFDERLAREIMIPRTNIVALESTATYEEVLAVIANEQYTRYPIYTGDRDNIIGFLNIKHLLTEQVDRDQFVLTTYMSPVIRNIETTPIKHILKHMQKEQTQLAILLDEYGGTSGMVTAEDIIEEIVGEIRDEFDGDEISPIKVISANEIIVQKTTPIHEVEKALHITIQTTSEMDTVYGIIADKGIDNTNLAYEIVGDSIRMKVITE